MIAKFTNLEPIRAAVIYGVSWLIPRAKFSSKFPWLYSPAGGGVVCGNHSNTCINVVHTLNGSRVDASHYFGYIDVIVEQIARASGTNRYEYVTALSGGSLKQNTITAAAPEWTGLLGFLQRHEADVVLGPMSVTPERLQHFAFTQPLTTSTDVVTIRNYEDDGDGSSSDVDFLSLLRPYHHSTWLALLVSMIACTILLTACDWVRSTFVLRQRRTSRGRSCLFDFEAIFHDMIRQNPTLTEAAQRQYSSNRVLRMFVLTWAMFCTIFMAVYPAELSSTLSVAMFQAPPFHDFVTMHAAGYKIVGIQGTSSASSIRRFELETRGTPDNAALKEVVVPEDKWPLTQAALIDGLLRKDMKWATFAISPGYMFPANLRGRCDLAQVPLRYKRQDGSQSGLLLSTYSFVLRLNDSTNVSSRYKLVDNVMTRLRQYGIFTALEKIRTIWQLANAGAKNYFLSCNQIAGSKQSRSQKNQFSSKALGIRHVTSTFLLLGIGAVIATASYVAEWLLLNKTERKRYTAVSNTEKR